MLRVPKRASLLLLSVLLAVTLTGCTAIANGIDKVLEMPKSEESAKPVEASVEPPPSPELKVAITISASEKTLSSIVTLFTGENMPSMKISIDGKDVGEFNWSDNNQLFVWLSEGRHKIKLSETNALLFGKSESISFDVKDDELISGYGYSFTLKYSAITKTLELEDETSYEEKANVAAMLNEYNEDNPGELGWESIIVTDVAYAGRIRLCYSDGTYEYPLANPYASYNGEPVELVSGEYYIKEIYYTGIEQSSIKREEYAGLTLYTEYSSRECLETEIEAMQEQGDSTLYDIYYLRLIVDADGTYSIFSPDITDSGSYTIEGNKLRMKSDTDNTASLLYIDGATLIQYEENSDGLVTETFFTIAPN